MENALRFISSVLDPISVVVGILLAIPVFWTWWEVTFGRNRRHRRWFEQARKNPGRRDAILIADLLDQKDVRTSIENFRRSHPVLKAVPEERIFLICRNHRLAPSDMPELRQDLRRASADILRTGAGTLHLFYAGPLAPLAMVGAEFANLCQVQVYQHAAGTYENWGPIRHDFE